MLYSRVLSLNLSNQYQGELPGFNLNQSQPTTQTCDPSILDELANQYQGELPGFEPNLERASEIAYEEVVSEIPQQYEPNLEMASNTCSDLIIHPIFQPYHLNATHSNISFGVALRNLANKKSSTHKLLASDINPSLSEEPTLVVQPLSVALPSEATFESQLSHENSIGLEFMITSDSDDEDEQANRWFRPGFLNQPLRSSSPFGLEFIHDRPYIAPSQPMFETSTIDAPRSSNQTCFQTITTVVSPPPTVLLDSIILKEVCENIFKDLNKLVKTRNNFVHKKDYVNEWARLRERVDFVVCELQKTSLEAHDKALNTLNEWFTEVVKSMEEVYDNMNQEKSKLYISDTPIYMDALSIITSSVQSENPDLTWLTKMKIQAKTPILEKLKNDSKLETEKKQLKKELLERRLMYAELQRKMFAQEEATKVREEALLKGYNDFKNSMDKQSERSNSMMQEMLELMKKQTKP